ncbi:hypothetical protein X777_01403 [Ooceraea biroi]|uniref:Uncharacterized protein n=1 Tax=Ooceraea biroi TaxID=2015173 RepID=A0A026WPN9_OOCBI|nr:hypothetical protein X777_01403 [Ooceraea biroi]
MTLEKVFDFVTVGRRPLPGPWTRSFALFSVSITHASLGKPPVKTRPVTESTYFHEASVTSVVYESKITPIV